MELSLGKTHAVSRWMMVGRMYFRMKLISLKSRSQHDFSESNFFQSGKQKKSLLLFASRRHLIRYIIFNWANTYLYIDYMRACCFSCSRFSVAIGIIWWSTNTIFALSLRREPSMYIPDENNGTLQSNASSHADTLHTHTHTHRHRMGVEAHQLRIMPLYKI